MVYQNEVLLGHVPGSISSIVLTRNAFAGVRI